ncbi:hypothetical protein [Scytonema sp. NUACC21]
MWIYPRSITQQCGVVALVETHYQFENHLWSYHTVVEQFLGGDRHLSYLVSQTGARR